MTSNDNGPPDLLTKLARLNPMVVVFATLAVFLGVLFLPDVIGAGLVLVIVGGLLWLLSKTWPVLSPAARGMRLVVIGILLVVAVLKVTSP